MTAEWRRNDFVVALAMLVGGSPPAIGVIFATAGTWPEAATVVLSVVLFFLGAFVGGVLMLPKEARRG